MSGRVVKWLAHAGNGAVGREKDIETVEERLNTLESSNLNTRVGNIENQIDEVITDNISTDTVRHVVGNSTSSLKVKIQTMDGFIGQAIQTLPTKQDKINLSNTLPAPYIGDGSVSSAEFATLDGVTSGIQSQIDSKQNSLNSSNRLPASHIGDGSVNDTELATLNGVTSGIQSQIDSKENTLSISNTSGLTKTGSALSLVNPVGIRCNIRNGSNNAFELLSDGQNVNSNLFALRHDTYGQTRISARNQQNLRLELGGYPRHVIFSNGNSVIGPNPTSPSDSLLYVNGNFKTQYVKLSNRSEQGYVHHPFHSVDLPGNPSSTATYQRNFAVSTNNNANHIFNGGSVLRLAINGGTKCNLLSNGNFGIAINTPDEKLRVNGVVKCNSLTQTSDDRIKDNEKHIEDALNTIMKLKPQIYDKYDDLNKTGTPTKEAGLITQEVYYQAPELRHLVLLGKEKHEYEEYEKNEGEDENVVAVKSFKTPTPVEINLSDHDIQEDLDYNNLGWSNENPSSLNYIQLIPYLIKGMQEQNQLIVALSQKVEALENGSS